MNFDRLFRSVEPATLPLTPQEVRTHLVISDTTQDAYLLTLIEAATAMLDGPHGIGIALMPQTYEYSLNGLWPSFTIPIYPVMSVDKIEWHDETGARSSTDLRMVRQNNPVTVYHDITARPKTGSIVVTFQAGFDRIPADLRHALLMIVGHLYENREATSTDKLETVPMAVETILSRYRVA